MKRTVSLVFAVSLCMTPVIAADDEPLAIGGGRWWAEKIDFVSRIAKAAYVKGFWDRFQIDCATEKEKHISQSIFCPPNGILESNSIEMGQILTRVEIFYKDSRNLRVPEFGAIEYVIFSLDGMSPDFLQGFLNDLRAPK